jgi:hypothetical protein
MEFVFEARYLDTKRGYSHGGSPLRIRLPKRQQYAHFEVVADETTSKMLIVCALIDRIPMRYQCIVK